MAGNLTAQDLLRPAFLRLGAGHTLREALGILLDPQARREDPRVLVVLGADGSFAGLITSRDLLRALLPAALLGENAATDDLSEQTLQGELNEKLALKVTSAMNRDVPAAAPGDRLLCLIELMREQELECLPVIDNGRVLGLVHLTDVFNAAAGLALASQTDGVGGEPPAVSP